MIFEKYIELIKKGEFFEAHEILEEEWQNLRKTDNEIKWAYKGLINAAVAMELKKRGRTREVYEKVWNNFLKYEKYYSLNETVLKTAEFIKKYKL